MSSRQFEEEFDVIDTMSSQEYKPQEERIQSLESKLITLLQVVSTLENTTNALKLECQEKINAINKSYASRIETLQSEFDFFRMNTTAQIELLQNKSKKQAKDQNRTTLFFQSLQPAEQFIAMLHSSGKVPDLTIKLDELFGENLEEYLVVNIDRPLHIRQLALMNSTQQDACKRLRIVGNHQVTIEDCTFNGIGLDIESKSKVIVKQADFVDTPLTSLIVKSSSESELKNINIANAGWHGVHLDHCKNVDIVKMNIHGCQHNGMVTDETTFKMADSSFSNCEIGMRLQKSSKGTCVSNVLINFTRGEAVMAHKGSQWKQDTNA